MFAIILSEIKASLGLNNRADPSAIVAEESTTFAGWLKGRAGDALHIPLWPLAGGDRLTFSLFRRSLRLSNIYAQMNNNDNLLRPSHKTS